MESIDDRDDAFADDTDQHVSGTPVEAPSQYLYATPVFPFGLHVAAQYSRGSGGSSEHTTPASGQPPPGESGAPAPADLLSDFCSDDETDAVAAVAAVGGGSGSSSGGGSSSSGGGGGLSGTNAPPPLRQGTAASCGPTLSVSDMLGRLSKEKPSQPRPSGSLLDSGGKVRRVVRGGLADRLARALATERSDKYTQREGAWLLVGG